MAQGPEWGLRRGTKDREAHLGEPLAPLVDSKRPRLLSVCRMKQSTLHAFFQERPPPTAPPPVPPAAVAVESEICGDDWMVSADDGVAASAAQLLRDETLGGVLETCLARRPRRLSAAPALATNCWRLSLRLFYRAPAASPQDPHGLEVLEIHFGESGPLRGSPGATASAWVAKLQRACPSHVAKALSSGQAPGALLDVEPERALRIFGMAARHLASGTRRVLWLPSDGRGALRPTLRLWLDDDGWAARGSALLLSALADLPLRFGWPRLRVALGCTFQPEPRPTTTGDNLARALVRVLAASGAYGAPRPRLTVEPIPDSVRQADSSAAFFMLTVVTRDNDQGTTEWRVDIPAARGICGSTLGGSVLLDFAAQLGQRGWLRKLDLVVRSPSPNAGYADQLALVSLAASDPRLRRSTTLTVVCRGGAPAEHPPPWLLARLERAGWRWRLRVQHVRYLDDPGWTPPELQAWLERWSCDSEDLVAAWPGCVSVEQAFEYDDMPPQSLRLPRASSGSELGLLCRSRPLRVRRWGSRDRAVFAHGPDDLLLGRRRRLLGPDLAADLAGLWGTPLASATLDHGRRKRTPWEALGDRVCVK